MTVVSKPRVYYASASAAAHLVKPHMDFFSSTIDFTSTWVDALLGGAVETPDSAKLFWQQDYNEIQASDYLFLWCPLALRLRGALVEVGMAITLGKPVFVAGNHADYSTWQYHPQVHRFSHWDQGLNAILTHWATPRSEPR